MAQISSEASAILQSCQVEAVQVDAELLYGTGTDVADPAEKLGAAAIIMSGNLRESVIRLAQL